MPTRQGSFHLFRLFGIDVFLHWSWFLVAIYEIQSRAGSYGSIAWNIGEYVALFGIVLLHEFGHALACRQVGGQANQIVLWPLGGVAYVSPPQRPGAMLWSIAAGPLVNVLLLPLLTILWAVGHSGDWTATVPNLYRFIHTLWLINVFLLIFNLMPVYPLDGGQLLRSLLWFPFGRARSLLIATGIGFVGVAGLIIFAVWAGSLWIGILSVFIVLNCWRGLVQARALSKVAAAPRRDGFACPECKAPPPVGPFWVCGKCREGFDTFQTLGTCPRCGARYSAAACVECGALRPIHEWMPSPVEAPPQI